MDDLKIYGQEEINAATNLRSGETKIGEKARFVSTLEEIAISTAQFVLIGIPEDIGVRANHGVPGTATAWAPALKALLNVQSTPFFSGEELLILGHFDFTDPAAHTLSNLQQKVEEIDAQVYPVIQKIIEAGKVPIVIGGGHNNAYPMIKGSSRALNKPIDVINMDAHADLRPTDGRHSGNGFSYAIKDDFLNVYGIFGLHQNYNNNAILETISENMRIHAVFFDNLLKSGQPLSDHWQGLLKQTGPSTGLELDLDCIADVLSSAAGPSGFSLNEIRKLVLTSGKKFMYLHLCEGAVALIDGRKDQTTAKTIAYLISDFIKSQK
jgi:formiminoglutamase